MKFSDRTGLSNLNPIARAQYHAALAGTTLRPLNDSNPTKHGLGLPELGVYEADPKGQLHARQALANFLKRSHNDVDPDDIYLLNSTSQAYSWVFKLLCNPGEIILQPRPGYPLIESIAQLEAIETVSYDLHYDGSWFIDIPSIKKILDGPEGSRVRAIVLINPNNPTGSYLHPCEREEIVALCQQYDLAIIADEVFYDYALEPLPGQQRLAGEQTVLTFALDGFSKMLAAPQAKVAWIQVSGPEGEVAAAKNKLDAIADDYLPMSQLVAEHIPYWLSKVHGQTSLVRRRCQSNLHSLYEAISGPQCPISLLRPEAGWNVLLQFPSVIDENELVLHLLNHYGYIGQPGYFFDFKSNGYMAISLLPEEKEFSAGIRSLLCAVHDFLS